MRRCSSTAKDAAVTDLQEGSAQSRGTVPSTTISLAKGIVGSGVLSLSASVGAFSTNFEGVVVALGLMVLFVLLAGYTFWMVAKTSAETGARDFGEAWSATVGKRSIWIPRLAVSMIGFMACVIYAMIISDALVDILRGLITALGSSGGGLLPRSWVASALAWLGRGPVLLVLSVFALLPMCLTESYANLALTSFAGLAGCVYLAVFTVWRALDGSYMPGGRFFHAAGVSPMSLVHAKGLAEVLNMKVFVLVSTLSMAFMNHGVAPGTLQEMSVEGAPRGEGSPSAPQVRLKRYSLAVLLAFLLAGVLNSLIMVAGFLTFGPATHPFVLASYASTDMGATIGRVCVMASLLFGFPLNFFPFRAEVLGALPQKLGIQARPLSVVLLAIIALLAMSLKDLGRVQAVGGALCGSFVVYLAPPLMARALRQRQGKGCSRWRAAFEATLIGAGVLSGIVGVAVSLF